MMNVKLNRLIASFVFGLILLTSHTSLQAMILSIDEGSSWCFDNLVAGFGCIDLQNPITGHDGIRIGDTQPASGSHSGYPNGTEIPGIDNPWVYLAQTGMHLTTSPVTILSQTANSMELDFSGWGMTWDGYPLIPLGTGAWRSWNNSQDGIASVTCSTDCSNGDTYQLQYSATIPLDDPSVLAGVTYALDITGTISAVPLPGALLLLGSGLVGLIGVARLKKT